MIATDSLIHGEYRFTLLVNSYVVVTTVTGTLVDTLHPSALGDDDPGLSLFARRWHDERTSDVTAKNGSGLPVITITQGAPALRRATHLRPLSGARPQPATVSGRRQRSAHVRGLRLGVCVLAPLALPPTSATVRALYHHDGKEARCRFLSDPAATLTSPPRA